MAAATLVDRARTRVMGCACRTMFPALRLTRRAPGGLDPERQVPERLAERRRQTGLGIIALRCTGGSLISREDGAARQRDTASTDKREPRPGRQRACPRSPGRPDLRGEVRDHEAGLAVRGHIGRRGPMPARVLGNLTVYNDCSTNDSSGLFAARPLRRRARRARPLDHHQEDQMLRSDFAGATCRRWCGPVIVAALGLSLSLIHI